MKKNLVGLCGAVCAVLLLCHMNACKNPVITDKTITSYSGDNVSLLHNDTCTVILNTTQEIPLISSGVSTGVLGSMNDIFFGKTFASMYAQFLISNPEASFDSTPVVDSVILSVPFANDTSKYGKCNKPIDVLVYEVSQDMIPGSFYYHDDAFSIYPQAIGRLNNYIPSLVDSVIVDTTVQAPQMYIRLSNSFGQKLLNAQNVSSDSLYLSAQNFVGFFKGLYITTNTAKIGNGLMYFYLQGSTITIYYHATAGGTPIYGQSYAFQVLSYSVAVNHFDHLYQGYPVYSALTNPAPKGDKVAYVQSGGGTKVRVRIPGISHLPTKIAITKAELIVPVLNDVTQSDSLYPPPYSITLIQINDTLGTQLLNGNNASGIGVITTRLDNNGNSYKCYVFNLTETIQRILNGYYLNNGYYLEYSYTTNGTRVIVTNDPAKLSTQCKLNITYTKLQ